MPLLSLVIIAMSVLRPRRRTLERDPLRGRCPARLRALAILPTYNERDTIEAVIGWRARNARRGRAGGRRCVARWHGGPRPGARRGRAAGPPARSPGQIGALQRLCGWLPDRGLPRATTSPIEMDSDLSHDPAELPSLLSAAGGFDLVVGSRYVPGGSVTDWSRRRVALSRRATSTRASCWACRSTTRPAATGSIAWRSSRSSCASRSRADGYGFQVELVLRSHRLGFAVGEAPITFRDRAFGESKISNAIVVEALWMVTRWGFDLRFRSSPRV